MLEIAARLGKGVDFLRVDLYDTNRGVVLGEVAPGTKNSIDGCILKESQQLVSPLAMRSGEIIPAVKDRVSELNLITCSFNGSDSLQKGFSIDVAGRSQDSNGAPFSQSLRFLHEIHS